MAKYDKWLESDNLLRIEGWAREGLIDEQIAKNMGISRSTLNEWAKKFPDISDALKRGKAPVDLEVENALLKRALGYEYTEVTKERQFNRKTGVFELVVTKEVRKVVPPDPVSIIFWLKNRRPDIWKDRKGDLMEAIEDAKELGIIEIPAIKESEDE